MGFLKRLRARVFGGGKSFFPLWGVNNAGYLAENADILDTRFGYALAYSAVTSVYRAISLRADALDALPWRIERVYGSQVEEVASSLNPYAHPLGRAIVQHRVGLGKSFFYEISSNYDLFGERYVEIAYHPITRRPAMRVLHSAFVTPIISGRHITSYLYSDGRGTLTLAPEEVAFDARWNPHDTVRGLSLVSVALDAVNIDRNMKRFLRDFFVNNARPGLVVAPEGELNTFSAEQQARIRQEIQNFHRGAGGQYGTLVLDKPASTTPLDQPDLAGNVPLMEKMEREIMRTFGVPMSMAGDDQTSTYKQGREVYENFVANTILPLAVDAQDFVQTQIMSHFADPDIDRFRFTTEHLEYVSDAVIQKHEMARADYNAGLITLNEAREHIGYPALPNGDTRAPNYQPPAPAPELPPAPAPAPAPAPIARAADVDLTPTLEMAEEAAKALRWREEHGRGGTAIGVARARDIVNRRRLSPDTVNRMVSYFARHETDKDAPGWSPGSEGFPSAGRIAWGLWGGDPGRDWATRKQQQLNAKAHTTPTQPVSYVDNVNKAKPFPADTNSANKVDAVNEINEGMPDSNLNFNPVVGSINLLAPNAHELLQVPALRGRYDAEAALRELRAWRAFEAARRGKANKRAFEPRRLAGPMADEIAQAVLAGDAGIWQRMERLLRPDWIGNVVACVRAMERYRDIDLSVPLTVQEEVRQGAEWRRQFRRGDYDDVVMALLGGTVTIEQARELAAWFAEHEAGGEGWSEADEGFPSTSRINYSLRGGRAGDAWARGLLAKIEAADRQLQDIKDDFGGLLLPLLLLVMRGDVDDEAARERMRDLIAGFAESAYRAGLAEGGILDDLTPKQREKIAGLLARQQPLIDQFLDELLAQGLSDAQLEQRVRLWANGALQPIFNEAVEEANADGLYMWLEGDTQFKCPDCVRLDGQIHRWSEYLERNLMPQTPGQNTECGGWMCQCTLNPVVGRSRGNW